MQRTNNREKLGNLKIDQNASQNKIILRKKELGTKKQLASVMNGLADKGDRSDSLDHKILHLEMSFLYSTRKYIKKVIFSIARESTFRNVFLLHYKKVHLGMSFQ
jgi:hypothetical protein